MNLSYCNCRSKCDNKCQRGPIGPKGDTGATGASFLDFGTSCTFFTRNIFPGLGCTGCTGKENTIFIHAEVAATPFPSLLPLGNPYSVFKADECPEINPNIDLVIEPKGNGAILATEPSLLPSGGNDRGAFATDFQRRRTSVTQVASGEFSVIGGGQSNEASGQDSFVGGGQRNVASFVFSTVGGGLSNTASGQIPFIGSATVGGGQGNTASGDVSTVSGGGLNTASGQCSTIPGGCFNTASGINSFATGFNAQAIHDNSFVYGGAPGITTTTADNQAIFNLRPAAFNTPVASQTFIINGELFVNGTFTSSQPKLFTIDHPVLENKHLRHICVEAPRADLMYRGTVQLVNGKADVDIDASSKMTNTTFSALAKNVDAYFTNNSNWDLVKVENRGLLSTGKFTIISNNLKSNAIINWLVIAERKLEEEMLVEIDKPKITPEIHSDTNSIETKDDLLENIKLNNLLTQNIFSKNI